MIPIVDFPKIKSPFVRETINGRYVVTPKIEEGYEWVFEDNAVRAVDKLHGTNVCVHFEGGIFKALDNRTTRIIHEPNISLTGSKTTFRMIQAVINAIEMKLLDDVDTASIYGEIIGPTWNGNIHRAEQPLFVPFDRLREKYHWHSWINNHYPKTFKAISEWFKELPSLFSDRKLKRKAVGEGIVFTHPDGRMAKLRRDMFDWYEGESHELPD